MRGLSNINKRKAIFEFFRDRADVVCLQETHCIDEFVSEWNSQWGGKGFYANGTSNSRGVCILIKKGCDIKVHKVHRDQEGRFIAIEALLEDQNVSIVNIYAPNQDTPSFFVELEKNIKELTENVILLGDFNLALDSKLDRWGTIHNNDKAKGQLEILMSNCSMCDVWRERNKEEKYFSWLKSSKNGENVKASRLDMILVSQGCKQRVLNVTYLPSLMTDHSAAFIVLNQTKYGRGIGYWKLNNRVIESSETQIEIRELIKLESNANKNRCPISSWERIKKRVSNNLQQKSRQLAAEDKLIMSQLIEQVDVLQGQYPLTQSNMKLLNATQEDLNDLAIKRAKGVLFRSKVRWYEEGEKVSKYFFNLERERYNARCCFHLINSEGEDVTDFTQVIKMQEQFYTDLYTSNTDVEFNQENIQDKVIDSKFTFMLNKCITDDEVKIAIDQMQKGKSPGRDGLTIEFYKMFWDELKEPFMLMIQEVEKTTLLPDTMRQGVLNLIPKANKDTRYLANLRPITLLNNDYKIIEKVIANRIEPCLHDLVCMDQKGFIKGRNISINIRKLLDILQHTENEQIEAAILSCDFQKAFDKVEFRSLKKVLKFFEFPQKILLWTDILYNSFSLVVQNNGHFSEPVEVSRGLHQGGPCSSLYFVILVETLAINLRKNEDILGIQIQDILNLLNQFADDLDVMLTGGAKSLNAALHELTLFQQQTGLALNYDKTTVYRLGSLKASNAKWYTKNKVNWSSESIRVLGVDIVHSEDELLNINYMPLVAKTKNILKAWTMRRLSLIGKITVVNTLVASLFVYKMCVLPTIPSRIVKQIEDIISKFIWANKRPKISLRLLQNNKDAGGLNLIDLRKRDIALKVKWISILTTDTSIEVLAYQALNPILRADIWKCNIHYRDIEKIGSVQPGFWKDVWKAWAEYSYNRNIDCEQQTIWYNSNIKIQKQPFFWQEPYKKGLLYVHQLFSEQDLITAQEAKQLFNLTVMQYNALITAIPAHWLTYFRLNNALTYLPICPDNAEMITSGKLTSQKIYKSLTSENFRLMEKLNKWNNELSLEMSLDDFCLLFKRVYKISNVPRNRSFQYRILHRAVVTNKKLCLYGIKQSALCSLCNQHEETIRHLFFDCNESAEFWQQVQKAFERQGAQFRISYSEIVLNMQPGPAMSLQNLICLLGKQYIYRQRCSEKPLNFTEFEAQVYQTQNVERYIAIKNNNYAKHCKKWSRPM